MNRLHSYTVALLRLSRWREHVVFTVPVTLLGANMATTTPDAQVWIVLAANILAVTCAFMINDVEDAPDDARDPARAAYNVIASGDLSRGGGWLASVAAGLLAVGTYALAARAAFWTGVLTVALAFLYSWRGVRLKALPVVDAVSHALMLSSLLFLAGYLVYDSTPGRAWWAALCVGLVSVYGQLYNQWRDFNLDRAAGLHNTASVIGPANTRRLMYAALGMAAACFVITLLLGLWPWWLALVLVALLPVGLWFRPRTDLRGTAAVDLSGRAQLGFIVIAAAAMIIWWGANALT